MRVRGFVEISDMDGGGWEGGRFEMARGRDSDTEGDGGAQGS